MVNSERLRRSLAGCSVIGFIAAAILTGCTASKQFEPIPKGLDREKVEKQTIEMTAERFHFTPEEIHVKQGTLLTIKVKSIQGTHGFRIGEFGIDLTLEEGVANTVELYLPDKGEYTFRCSHFCGLGHPWMSGTLYVE